MTQGVNETLPGIVVEADLDGTYNLSLARRDVNQNPLPVPSSLQVPSTVTVSGGSGTFSLSAVNPQPVGA